MLGLGLLRVRVRVRVRVFRVRVSQGCVGFIFFRLYSTFVPWVN